jgi:3-phenylpropionate/cinnamic acid dioxygenase small subunit
MSAAMERAPAPGRASPGDAAAKAALLHEIGQFLYREARLQDEHRYAEWEALWEDDGVYWIPANGEDTDPETCMSIVYDNRSRIALRVRQLLTGRRHSQEPASRLRHIISNIELLADRGAELTVGANVLVFESNRRGETLWAARTQYVLRRRGPSFRMARKTVTLVNNDKPLYTLAFLI